MPQRPLPRSTVRRHAHAGLTLIELMVGLVILGVLISIGMPSFQGAINNAKLSAATNEFIGAIHTARSEAVRRNTRVVLCRSIDGAACSSSALWTGWLIFVDSNGDSAVSAGEEVVKSGTFDASLQIRVSPAISSQNHTIRFASNGLALGATETALYNARIALCVASSQPPNNVRDVTVAFGGRTTIQARSTGGDCSATPADT